MSAPRTVPVDETTARGFLPPAAVYIDGEYVTEAGGERHEHVHPGDGQPLGEWSLAGADDVDRAVRSARAAQQVWAALTPAQRRDTLLTVAEAYRAHHVELAAVAALEMGMPIRTAVAGTLGAVEWFRYYAGWADKIEGLVAPVPGTHDYAIPQPYGVVGAIIPWNGPAMGLSVKVAPALAAGNAVVLKPSDFAPLSGGLFAKVATDAGLPPGLFNVVTGGPAVGAALCAHPGVDVISFTGGNVAAREVGTIAAQRAVPTVLELGGKSASLVFADADVPRAAKLAAVLAVAQNSGQGCFLPTRLLVQRPVYEQALEIIQKTASGFTLGRPFEPATVMGPVANRQSYERILAIFERIGVDQDGELLTGGQRAGGDLADGFYIEPTVYYDVDPGSRLAREEVFGPVLSVLPFDDEDEAIRIANDNDFGLAGYVWTENLRRAHRVAAALDAGYVSVNSLAGLPPAAPFGGWKASGYGTEGGRQGLLQLMRTKNVHIGL
ncbi:MAG TPA: aldehyde dehydrogenase family protein [Jatrophihabitantaceae bacterium]